MANGISLDHVEELSNQLCAKFQGDWKRIHVQNSNFVWSVFPNMVRKMLEFEALGCRAMVSVIYH